MSTKTLKTTVPGSIIQTATFRPDSYGTITWIDAWSSSTRKTDLDFVRNAQRGWQGPKFARDEYLPTGTQVGSIIRFIGQSKVVHTAQVWSGARRPNSVWAVDDAGAVWLVDIKNFTGYPCHSDGQPMIKSEVAR